ncbi:hypothetical protein [Micromonospora sp. NPDC023633]|uniref:hypothetical protein n=1 Tax=Micromonospora sp. NPDC023633 TaxID=3154320 RepID=UPI003409A77F
MVDAMTRPAGAALPVVGELAAHQHAQSTATAVDDDALTIPERWVDHHIDQPQPA